MWVKGKQFTEEHKKKLSEIKKKNLPKFAFKKGQRASVATEFKKGHVPWQEGLTKETSEKIKKYADRMMNKKQPWEHKGMLGKKHNEEARRKISESHKGAKSYLWRGGITPQNKLERIKFRNKLQKLIFERDNYTCQICDVRGGILQIDHIQSWAKFKELRFDPDNCRTLCVKCHYKITFGREMPESIKTWGHSLKYKGISYVN